MLSCLGDDLAVPHNPDPTGNDVLSIVGGHLDVHLPAVLLEGRGHVKVPAPGSEAIDFNLSLAYHTIELVNGVSGLLEVLVGDCGLLAYCGDEAVGDGMHGFLKVATLIHVEDGFGGAR